MKAFLASTLLFFVLLSLIIGNAVYVHRVSAHIRDELESMNPSNREETLAALEAYWQRHRKYVALSVSYRELDHLSELLLSLRACLDANDQEDFELYRKIAIDAADELSRLERFSIENLF